MVLLVLADWPIALVLLVRLIGAVSIIRFHDGP